MFKNKTKNVFIVVVTLVMFSLYINRKHAAQTNKHEMLEIPLIHL